MRLSVIIPIFNEASTAETLLRRVWEAPSAGLEKELLIVESNSTDGTRDICRKLAAEFERERPGTAILILQERPRGKGNAVREGLAAATGDIVLIQDGDLEYDVNDYPALLEPILSGKASFVLGSRHLAAGSWKIRKFAQSPVKATLLNFGAIFFHEFFNILYGQRLTDPTTMYKVFRRECVQGLYLVANRFDFDFELLGKLIRAGHRPLEVPVSYSSRDFKEGKKIRVIRDPLTWIRAIVRFRCGRLYTVSPGGRLTESHKLPAER